MSKGIEIRAQHFPGRPPIDTYGAGGFRFADMSHRGSILCLPSGVHGWDVTGAAAGLRDGAYTVAIRPNYVLPTSPGAGAVPMTGTVQITELSGSESTAHFRLGSDTWVSLAPGVHPYRVGVDHRFYMDPAHCFYFAPDGALAA